MVSKTLRQVRTRSRRSPLALGRRGEELAAQYLRGLGMIVLSRNWRCREGELDLVATDRKVLVVCEVKTRSGRRFGEPAEAVTQDKVARVRRMTSRWLAHFRVAWCPVRFDVIAVDYPPDGRPSLRHIVGAF
ncbi:YraN family protein [Saccharomonospora sp. NPDC046836]|uniref:YraN family protein n=1 Tax=Saccharomonospora sp. NPDC046836 TaxID=3156921 RepID=UPI0033D8A820